MTFHARRLLGDLRAVLGWVASMSLLVLVVSMVATFQFAFGLAENVRARPVTAGVDMATTHLGTIDPTISIITTIETQEDMTASVLDDPAMQVLARAMSSDDRMYLVLPLDAFIAELGVNRELQAQPLAVVGKRPSFLPEAASGSEVVVWGGLLTSGERVPDITPTRLMGHPVRQADVDDLAVEYMTGVGPGRSEDRPVATFDVRTATDLGVTEPPSVADVVASFTCECPLATTRSLASAMSDAASDAGTPRTFVAVEGRSTVGDLSRSRAATDIFIAAQAIATLVGLCLLGIALAHLLWTRRAHTWKVERRLGAGEAALHLRAQFVLLLALALPLLLGWKVVVATLEVGASPPPPGSRATTVALFALAAIQFSASTPMVTRIRTLGRLDGSWDAPGGQR